jgi:diguanylate cyclase (GGDEF)-like protein
VPLSLRAAFDHGTVAQCVIDAHGRVVLANRAFTRLTGAGVGALAGDVLPAEAAEALALGGEAEHALGDRWVVSRVSLVGDQIVWQATDVTALRERADVDPLSGAANRRRFEAELDAALRRARRYGGRVGLVLIDLDGFKAVNDQAGHAEGDRVIREVGAALREAVRDTDVVGRLGGDELAVILPSVDEEGAGQVAGTLLSAVRPAGITASIGAAVSRDDGADTPAELLAAADAAMYDAKADGGDRFRVARHGLGGLDLRTAWVDRLREAPRAGRFRLHAQPLVPLRAEPGAPPHHELLLRYVGPDGELVVPGRFLGIAERFGLAPAIDQWVLEQAVGLLRRSHEAGRPLRLSVNVSRLTLGREPLAAQVCSLLAGAALPPGALTVEVTETAVMADLERAADVLGRLREEGVRVAIDDFGTGASSLLELRHLPVDELKIDGAFVRGAIDPGPDRVIVEAVVHLARGLGARTVGEVVADDRSLAALRAAGVDAAQGYHLGMPRPVEDLLELAA